MTYLLKRISKFLLGLFKHKFVVLLLVEVIFDSKYKCNLFSDLLGFVEFLIFVPVTDASLVGVFGTA
jgi:hypothetical protein